MLPCFLSESPPLLDVYVAGAEGAALCVDCGQLDPAYISAVRTGGGLGEDEHLLGIYSALVGTLVSALCVCLEGEGLCYVGAGTHAAWSRIDIIGDPKSRPS